MSKYEFIKFKVICPNDNYHEYDMKITAIKLEDGSLLPSPCNGCDFLNGDSICNYCRKAITSYFIKNINNESFKINEPLRISDIINS